MKIRLMENFRAIFYAPYYAAQVLDFYAREGVDVQMFPSDTPGDAISHLTNNTIDLTWAGPMRVMLARDQNAGSGLVAFAEVVSRDPFFLIGKCRSFNLSNLTHLRFATVSEVPTPWMCLQHDLRENGINPDTLIRVSSRTMSDNYASLCRGELDVMQAFEPFASMAEMDQAGEVLYAAAARGPTVYTAFITTGSAVTAHRDAFAAMTRALAKMEQWLYTHSAKELADVVASFFPRVPRELLERSLQRYHDADLWAHDPAMSRQGFDRLGASFVSGRLLSRPPIYEDCIAQYFA
jgi:NitT/TauT family transport system substrate-binding protein